MKTTLNQTYKARTVKLATTPQSNKETPVRQAKTSPIHSLPVFTNSKNTHAAKPSFTNVAGNRKLKARASGRRQVRAHQKSRQLLPRTICFKRERDDAAKIGP
jgi:hypothetical protein